VARQRQPFLVARQGRVPLQQVVAHEVVGQDHGHRRLVAHERRQRGRQRRDGGFPVSAFFIFIVRKQNNFRLIQSRAQAAPVAGDDQPVRAQRHAQLVTPQR
jgi:hypothetical protein